MPGAATRPIVIASEATRSRLLARLGRVRQPGAARARRGSPMTDVIGPPA